MKKDMRAIRRAKGAMVSGIGTLVFLMFVCGAAVGGSSDLNTSPPASPVKLIFIHHSCGENWLSDSDGGLGTALRDNNYFVSDTNYGWGPDSIGDSTDIGQWYTWFCGTRSAVYLDALYRESNRSGDFYSRLSTDPGGENEIIMFKSCFPNSYLGGTPDDPPVTGDNPLRGEDSGSEYMTVGHAKGIYNDLLGYFKTRPDKLFVVITAPPLVANVTDSQHAANARAFHDWLVRDWLRGYPYHNVAVFDFFNVLTSNGGDTSTNDQGWETGNHHRYYNGTVQHIHTVSQNVGAYGSDLWDSHPSQAGNQKATAEYVPLLNIYYHCWKGDGACPDVGMSDVPVPRIQANGRSQPLSVAPGTVVSITLALDPHSQDGTRADWWVAYQKDGVWHCYVYPSGWTTGIQPAYQGPLFSLSSVEILRQPLAEGSYVFYFGVDTRPDGSVSGECLYYNGVEVSVH